MSYISPPAVSRPWKRNPYQEATPTSNQRFAFRWPRKPAFAPVDWVPAIAWAGCIGILRASLAGAPSLAEAVSARAIMVNPDASPKTGSITLFRVPSKIVLLIHTLHLLLSGFDPPKSNIRKQLVGIFDYPKRAKCGIENLKFRVPGNPIEAAFSTHRG
jgi:hypothetical protein